MMPGVSGTAGLPTRPRGPGEQDELGPTGRGQGGVTVPACSGEYDLPSVAYGVGIRVRRNTASHPSKPSVEHWHASFGALKDDGDALGGGWPSDANDTSVTARPVVYPEHPLTSPGTVEAPCPSTSLVMARSLPVGSRTSRDAKSASTASAISCACDCGCRR